MRRLLIVTIALTVAAASHAQSKVTLKVHTGKGQQGYDVNSTMVMGEKDMIVIDPQFTRQKFWFPTYGNNIPGPEPVLPEELTAQQLTLEGETFPITGGARGADGLGNSYVWIPSLKAVVTGDIVFDHAYMPVPRDMARENWLQTIDQLIALQPQVIVPGHEGPGATRNLQSIAFMKQYYAD